MRPKTAALAAIVLGATLTSACADNPTKPVPDPDACRRFVVPQEMGLGWDKINHRVAAMSVRLDHDHCRARKLQVTQLGGDFSTGEAGTDTPYVDFAYQRVDTPHPNVGAARVTQKEYIGPEGTLTKQHTYDRRKLHLLGFEQIVPFVEGFQFDTGIEQVDGYPDKYDAVYGYTSRGIGMSVRVSELTDTEVTIEYTIRFETGGSPDRPSLNKALAYARVLARLDVLLVGVDGWPVHQGDIAYDLSYDRPKPFQGSNEMPLEGASEETQTLQVAGTPGDPPGFYGLSAFDLKLTFDPACRSHLDCVFGDTCGDDGECDMTEGLPGEYIRALRAGVEMTDYDETSGEATFLVDGYASNASQAIAFMALRNHFTAHVSWIQTSAVSERHQFEKEFDTGDATFPLE